MLIDVFMFLLTGHYIYSKKKHLHVSVNTQKQTLVVGII